MSNKLIIVIGRHVNNDLETILKHFSNDSKNIETFPEYYLHPWDQLLWIENHIIKQTCNSLIITNSSYIIDHMSDLMVGYKHKNECADLLLTKDPNAFIDPVNVEILEFNDGYFINILEIKNEHIYIDWHTFSEPSRWVANNYSEIMDRIDRIDDVPS
jgi:hypothetical protein